jgi:hypothetical protein
MLNGSPNVSTGYADPCADIDAQLRPMTLADLPALVEAAKQDDHVVICPTHVITKKGEIVGYVSIGSVWMVNAWVDSRRVNRFESTRLLRESEEVAEQMGGAAICVPCAQTSPFYPYMKRLGYDVLGFSSFNLKMLAHGQAAAPVTKE